MLGNNGNPWKMSGGHKSMIGSYTALSHPSCVCFSLWFALPHWKYRPPPAPPRNYTLPGTHGAGRLHTGRQTNRFLSPEWFLRPTMNPPASWGNPSPPHGYTRPR